MYENWVLTVLWLELGLSHGYASLIWNRPAPQAVTVLCRSHREVIENPKRQAHERQDGANGKDPGFHHVAVVVAKVHAL